MTATKLKKEPVRSERTVYFDAREIEIVTGSAGKSEARFNPRTLSNPGFSPEEMTSLRKGIARDGLNHSLLVRLDPTTQKPKLVAGERRLRAISQLIEQDEEALERINNGEKGVQRVIVRNPVNGKMEPALKVYGEQGVECKITNVDNEKEYKRQAIQENTLHESLTDYELLLQCKEMEESDFSRAEQAETMDVSEAWISQSHGLLKGPQCILTAMEKGQLTRTAALTFLNVAPEKVEEVLQRAIRLTYEDAEIKQRQAEGELNSALDTLQIEEQKLKLSQFTGNIESAKKARRHVARAGRVVERAKEKVDNAKKKKKKRITVETIMSAANDGDAAENLNKAQSMKHVRELQQQIADLLTAEESDFLTHQESGEKYSVRDVDLVNHLLQFVTNRNFCKHPFDAITMIAEKYGDAKSAKAKKK
jgi:hypothetical protein